MVRTSAGLSFFCFITTYNCATFSSLDSRANWFLLLPPTLEKTERTSGYVITCCSSDRMMPSVCCKALPSGRRTSN